MQIVEIDTTGLSHPEPFVMAMETLKGLKSGQYIKMTHRREPLKLYEVCEKLQYAFFVEEIHKTLFNIYICNNAHKDDLRLILKEVCLKEPQDYSNAACNTCQVLDQD